MKKLFLLFLILSALFNSAVSQPYITNVFGRKAQSLNGEWNALIDPYNHGYPLKVFLNKEKTDHKGLYEYSFDNAMVLNVPSDWNSQYPELQYYEGSVWYARHFDAAANAGERSFLYFGAVSYRCAVYLNGTWLGKHEGGFTPFLFEVTDKLLPENNFLVVEVNNTRTKDAIPAMKFDWWNYGGITRDVMLVSTPQNYIDDYFIQLDKQQKDVINIQVKLEGDKIAREMIQVEIPELKIKEILYTDEKGVASASVKAKKLVRWSPEQPKLYTTIVSSASDRVEEEIGFRNIRTEGTKILLNDKPLFLKGVNFHEEIPQRKGRAFSESDAYMLLSEAKELGCNMIRLAHYPQNEYIVRMAEKMGFILWEEIPVWQGIDFSDNATRTKAQIMLREMVNRDKNRCAIGLWSIANETHPSQERTYFLTSLIDCVRQIDTTRLITAAFDNQRFNRENGTYEMNDDFTDQLDVIGINAYLGWYTAFPAEPENIKWNIAPTKPLLFSEFGGEALYGQAVDSTKTHSWSEDYQEKIYTDNITMFQNIPNLSGTIPWLLYDFRSPYRLHPTYQKGWNRKGLISDQGKRKKAWYVMKHYYDSME